MHVNVIWKIFRRDGVKWRKNWRDGVMRGPAWGGGHVTCNDVLDSQM